MQNINKGSYTKKIKTKQTLNYSTRSCDLELTQIVILLINQLIRHRITMPNIFLVCMSFSASNSLLGNQQGSHLLLLQLLTMLLQHVPET